MKHFFKPDASLLLGILAGSLLMPLIMPVAGVAYLTQAAMTFFMSVLISFFMYGVVCALTKD